MHQFRLKALCDAKLLGLAHLRLDRQRDRTILREF
jgi:hypothetical protein